jgi:hypothetical protein
MGTAVILSVQPILPILMEAVSMRRAGVVTELEP